MDDFDLQYADELDAMEEFDIPANPIPPKPKRTLQFSTPGKTSQGAGNQELTPLGSPMPALNGSLLQPSNTWTTGPVKKRLREDVSGQSDSDLEYDDEDLNDAAQASKRSKFSQPGEGFAPEQKQESLHDHVGIRCKGPSVREEEEPPGGAEVPLSPKRQTMERILQHRSRLTTTREVAPNRPTEQRNRVEDYDFERPRVFQRIPTGRYLPTTGTSGERVYMALSEECDLNKEFDSYGKSLKGTRLLDVSVTDMIDELEEERRRSLLQETDQLSKEAHRQLNDDTEGFVVEKDDDQGNGQPVTTETADPQKLLWVEKYSPQQYTDLLSEESINRTLLRWLKLWDCVVFDKELPVPKKETKKENQNQKFKKRNQLDEAAELDRYLRPAQKVVLLCGPPGLGKTTLAHIIAKHAGYRVVEMNASDDRSAEVFKTKIESATQMKAVMGEDPRPNCLIIDEIDGAPQAAINVLLNLVKKTDTVESSKKKKKEEHILLRPIICICNDQYVPALRQLRQNALVLNFPETDPAKLAGRLQEICRHEKMKSDTNALLALCEKTDNDIRSCLNTLQFMERQLKELSLRSVQSLAVGQKDGHKSLFSVWNDIFTLPKPKRQRFVDVAGENNKVQVTNTAPPARFNHVLREVQGAGDYDKMTQGLFENFLECKVKDPHMSGVVLAGDWLCYTDLVNQYIQHSQDYRLMPYLPYVAVTFHFLFAANVPPKIQFPHSFSDCYLKRNKCENLLASMLCDVKAGVRSYLNNTVAVLELLPLLLDIIQPSFRPVNTQLYSAREKENLAQLVSVMIAYNMTYTQEKSLDGQYNYALDPHMEEVVRFTGMKQHRQLTYASKQLVAREVELEKMRRSEMSRARQQTSDPTTATQVAGQTDKMDKTSAVPNHLQRLSAKPLGRQTENEEVRDFFGRIVKKKTPESKKSSLGAEGEKKKDVLATDIWFHFQGGYTNAVRRNVRVKDFF